MTVGAQQTHVLVGQEICTNTNDEFNLRFIKGMQHYHQNEEQSLGPAGLFSCLFLSSIWSSGTAVISPFDVGLWIPRDVPPSLPPPPEPDWATAETQRDPQLQTWDNIVGPSTYPCGTSPHVSLRLQSCCILRQTYCTVICSDGNCLVDAAVCGMCA